MNARMKKILDCLSTGDYMTATAMAEKIALNEKTIRNTIAQMQDVLSGSGARIESKRRVGYRLVVEDQEDYDRFLSENDEEDGYIPEQADEREEWLLYMLLNRTDFIKMDELCDFLFVSRPTLAGNLRNVEQVLNEYNILLLRRPNYGIRVQGKEFDIRNCLIHHMLSVQGGHVWEDIHRYQGEMERIKQILLESVTKFGVRLANQIFQDLVMSIFVTIRRIRRNCLVPVEMSALQEAFYEKCLHVAQAVADDLAKEFKISIPDTEVGYIAINLAGKSNFGTFSDAGEQVIPQEVENLAIQMVEVVYETFHMDLRKNLSLIMNLSMHLVPMLVRIRYNIRLYDAMQDEVKQEYAFAYTVASQAVIPIKELYHAEVTGDEIAFLAVVFALALEQEHEHKPKKNILIICGAGMSSARLLAYQYEKEFRGYVNEVYSCDMFSVDRIDMDQIDYIFSTVPLPYKLPKPVIEVKNILNRTEAETIKTALLYGASEIITEMYRPELFFTDISGNTKEEVLYRLCSRIGESVELPEGFYQSVLQREEIAATDIVGNLVAIPHPMRLMTEESFACVCILPKPITWIQNEVQVIVMVSLAKDEKRDFQTFYHKTTGLIMDAGMVSALLDNRDYETFLKLLAQIK